MSEAQARDNLEWDLLDRLAKALRVAAISKQAMATELGVSRNTVGNYLAGRTTPSTSVLRVWALRCGVPYRWLASGDNGPGDPGGLPNQPSLCMTDDLARLRARRNHRLVAGAFAA